jgi:abortive infection bacteriophage resistance protein
MDLKKPYTLDEQIKKLKDHGVVISDDAFSRKVLQQVSYYRLSGYMLQYRLSTDSHEMTGTSTPQNVLKEMIICYCRLQKGVSH